MIEIIMFNLFVFVALIPIDSVLKLYNLIKSYLYLATVVKIIFIHSYKYSELLYNYVDHD